MRQWEGRSPGHARWCAHVNGVNPPRQMRQWLADPASLTAKLIARCHQFRVQRLHQRLGLCLADEFSEIRLARRLQVVEREVLLLCDGRPVVFAHTVLPLAATAADWPLFGSLGERSLGTTLFGDPLVVRGKLQFARLHCSHPLMRRVQTAVGPDWECRPLYARRSLFQRNGAVLLVSEIFLPGIAGLNQRTAA